MKGIYKINLRLLALLIMISIISFNSHAQVNNPKQKAKEILKKAIVAMDDGKYEESISLLIEAQLLDPNNSTYDYEIAYANYKQEKYQKAIDILETIKDKPDAGDVYFQLLGNSYDITGNSKKALAIYEEGMKRFPKSGKMYLESGIVKMYDSAYSDAINFWEKGVKVDPNFSSNYYWLAKMFSYSQERIWSMLYGEMFMLLEPGTKRSREISKLLYDVYQKSYEKYSDTSGEFKLTERGFTIVVKNKKDIKNINKRPLPFEGSYSMTYTMASINYLSGINLNTITSSRAQLLKLWFEEKKHNKDYPNKLLDYQYQILKSGYNDIYLQ